MRDWRCVSDVTVNLGPMSQHAVMDSIFLPAYVHNIVKNLGALDRCARMLFALLALCAAAGWMPGVELSRAVMWAFGTLAVYLGASALVAWCPVLTSLGLSTQDADFATPGAERQGHPAPRGASVLQDLRQEFPGTR